MAREDGGFTLVEMLFAITVFAVLASAFGMSTGTALHAYQVSRARTVGEQLGAEQLEEVRRMPYDQVGTVSGNPPGTIPSSKTVTVGGFTFSIQMRVSYVDDPLPGGFQTGANYKLVRTTVLWSGDQVAEMETRVAPPTQPSRNKAVAKVQVVDYALNTPVVGAVVNLGNGPSAPRSDVTNAAGEVVFAALDPNPSTGTTNYYDLTPTMSGYQTLPEDVPPGTAARAKLGIGQLFSTVLRVYKPMTMQVNLLDASSQPFTGPSTITFSSSRGAWTAAASGSTITLTTLGGAPIVSGLEYAVGATAASTSSGLVAVAERQVVPDGYPTNLTASYTLRMTPATLVTLNVRVRDTVGSSLLANMQVAVSGGPLDTLATGKTNASGIASVSVTTGSSPTYTVSVPAQAGYLASDVDISVTGTMTVTLDLSKV